MAQQPESVETRSGSPVPWAFFAAYCLAAATLCIVFDNWVVRCAVLIGVPICLAATLGIAGSVGKPAFYLPMRARDQVLPVLIAASMLGMVMLGLSLAVGDQVLIAPDAYFQGQTHTGNGATYWGGPPADSVNQATIYRICALATVGGALCGLLTFFYIRRRSPYSVAKRLVFTVFLAAVLELTAAIVCHAMAGRGGADLVQSNTGIAIGIGTSVGFWSIGPGIVLLLLNYRFKAGFQTGEDSGSPQPPAPARTLSGQRIAARWVGVALIAATAVYGGHQLLLFTRGYVHMKSATEAMASRQYDQAREHYLQAANDGNAAAMCYLGSLYMDGLGTAQDYGEALKWYRKAADGGNLPAMSNIGLMYVDGRGVPQDFAEALKWFNKAADAGYPRGFLNLGHMYQAGLGVPVDLQKAASLYRRALDGDDAQVKQSAQQALQGLNGL